MKRYCYQCDCGGILIGKDGFYAHYSNGVGDGRFDLYVYEKGENLPDSYEFVDTVEGSDFEVLSYDSNPLSAPIAVCHLTGRFGVYQDGNGDMALQYWEETKLSEEDVDL